MKLLLGLDIGTTAMKIALFDRTGALLAVSTQEYDLLTPAPNYVEEKPEVYWDAFCTCLLYTSRKEVFGSWKGSVSRYPEEDGTITNKKERRKSDYEDEKSNSICSSNSIGGRHDVRLRRQRPKQDKRK